jgi:hypothetical protein
MWSQWIRVGPKPNDWCPCLKRREHTGIHTDTKIRVMQLQAKECPGFPKTPKAKKRQGGSPSLDTSEEAWPGQHLGSGQRESISAVLSCPVCDTSLGKS